MLGALRPGKAEMKKQEFIDALYEAGWSSPCDAQHENIGKLWRKMHPELAKMEDEMADAIEQAHMAGQHNSDGCDPSYSAALAARNRTQLFNRPLDCRVGRLYQQGG